MSTPITRKRILEAALRLFNESGTAAVSTNHIAAEAGISSGNLYYHYRNKQEIIRDLVEEELRDYDALWRLPHEHRQGLEILQGLVRTSFEVQWRYRFLGREMVALTRQDPILRQRLQIWYQKRMQQQKAFIQRLIDSAALHPARTETELNEMLTACSVIMDAWLSFLEVTGQPVTYEQFQAGSQIVARVIQSG